MTSNDECTSSDTVVNITAWRDTLLSTHGFHPHSREFAGLWTPLLGPAAAALYRSLADLVATASTASISGPSLAASIGIGQKKAASTIERALGRLAQFDLVRSRGDSVAVRMHAPPPAMRHRRSVPKPWRHLAIEEHQLAAQAPATST